MNTDFILEKRLQELDQDLHRRFRDMVFSLQHILSHYKILFPEFTDHTELHSMAVIDFCNQLIGTRQIQKLNADAIYILLSACYLHDSGMGINQKQYEEFKKNLPEEEYFREHPTDTIADFIRSYHHEFSGMFIRKFADFFEIPSEEHLFAIIQVARGHRRTNLFDEEHYPIEYKLPNGNTVCLTYLAALIRLADEIHVAASRNPILMYDLEALTMEIEIRENRKLKAVRNLRVREKSFKMHVDKVDDALLEDIKKVQDKMQRTLDYCREATNGRTPFTITQEKVILEYEDENGLRNL